MQTPLSVLTESHVEYFVKPGSSLSQYQLRKAGKYVSDGPEGASEEAPSPIISCHSEEALAVNTVDSPGGKRALDGRAAQMSDLCG